MNNDDLQEYLEQLVQEEHEKDIFTATLEGRRALDRWAQRQYEQP